MALFNQSTLPASAAIAQIAGAAGASADSEMLSRAMTSYNAAIQHWNIRANWDFAYVEADPIKVYGYFGVTGVSAAASQTSALCPVGHGFVVDDVLAGSPFFAGTRVSATASASIGFGYATLSTISTSGYSVTATRDLYAVPSDYKKMYSMRLLVAQKAIYSVTQRMKGRSVTDENTASTPSRYDTSTIGKLGKVRLVPAPSSDDILLRRYYRRITQASATGDGTAMDVPIEHEPYVIAWAKWHFLTDKNEGRNDQGITWLRMAEDGLKVLLGDQTRNPDEDLGFFPGHYQYEPSLGPNTVRHLMDE